MNPLWFCTTASLIALCAICLVTKVYKELRFYSGMQALFALLALVFIWAYYSPRVSQSSYEELFWWKQHFTQASEIVLCVYLLNEEIQRPSRLKKLLAYMNGGYALIKYLPSIVSDIPQEVEKSFLYQLQQWTNFAVIIGSGIAILWLYPKEKVNAGRVEGNERDGLYAGVDRGGVEGN